MNPSLLQTSPPTLAAGSIVHATAVAVAGKAVLLLGPPGSGKSDLALRLLASGATLIGDDQIQISHEDGAPLPLLAAPPQGKHLLAVRGLGLLHFNHIQSAPCHLLVELLDQPCNDPLPDLAPWPVAGIPITRLQLHAGQASAPLRIMLALGLALPTQGPSPLLPVDYSLFPPAAPPPKDRS